MFLPLYDENRLRYLKRPYVNYAIIAVTALAFFLTGGFDTAAVEHAAIGLGLIPSVVNDIDELPLEYVLVPENATYITYALLHGDIFHLLGNLAFLWVFGDNVEDALGHIRYLIFYVVCAAGAGLVFVYMFPESPGPLVGCSGAVAGVVGAYLILHPRVRLWVLVFGRIPLGLSAMWLIGAWCVFQVYNVLVAAEDDPIAWWAHIGGLVIGALLVLVMRRRGVALFDRNVPETG